jgi:amino acid permease
LQLPGALKNAGWIGILFILYSAWAAFYTGRLLIECLYFDGVSRLHGFPEIGEQTQQQGLVQLARLQGY